MSFKILGHELNTNCSIAFHELYKLIPFSYRIAGRIILLKALPSQIMADLHRSKKYRRAPKPGGLEFCI
jgi:hypothetical protein